MAAIRCDLGSESSGPVGLRIIRGAVAVGFDLGIVEPGHVAAEKGVCRQAAEAAIDFGGGKRNPFARGGRQRASAQRAEQAEMAFKRQALSPRNGDGWQPGPNPSSKACSVSTECFGVCSLPRITSTSSISRKFATMKL